MIKSFVPGAITGDNPVDAKFVKANSKKEAEAKNPNWYVERKAPGVFLNS